MRKFLFFVLTLTAHAVFAETKAITDKLVHIIATTDPSYGLSAFEEFEKEHNLQLNSHATNGISPLLYAIETGHEQIAELLLDRGYEANHSHISDAECQLTPLQTAIYKSQVSIIPSLLEHGATFENMADAAITYEAVSIDKTKKDFLGNPLKVYKGLPVSTIEPITMAILSKSNTTFNLLLDAGVTIGKKSANAAADSICIYQLFPEVFPRIAGSNYDSTFAMLYSTEQIFRKMTNVRVFSYNAWSEAVWVCILESHLNCIDKVQHLRTPENIHTLMYLREGQGENIYERALRTKNLGAIKILMRLGLDPYTDHSSQDEYRELYSPILIHKHYGGTETDGIGRVLLGKH